MELTSPSVTESIIDESEDPLIKGQWQWKSNPNPWCKTEKPQWTSYPPKQNYLIEKASYDGQKEVRIGEYIVFPQDKLQKSKHNHDAQRPVRRVKQSEIEGDERSQRYSQTENPKTLNKVFGTLEDFIHFISKRNNEILEFKKSFENAQQSKDLEILNQNILPQLAACIREELKILHSQEPKIDSLSPFQIKFKEKVDQRNQELILMFEKQLSSFEEFYERVLKAYTMNTFLYQNLNQYLRNEDWIELDRLSPYLFCLCKAFLILKTTNENLPVLNLDESESVILYRGTALDEEALSDYNIKKQRNFSWNAVTSTTKNLAIAENFMYLSADLAKRKYPVLFIIEVPLSIKELGYLGHLGVKSYSAKPQEDEVILPPGSVFELQEVFKDNDGTRIIKIQLNSDFKRLDCRGVIMHGARQNAMTQDRRTQIFYQRKRDLLETFKVLYGNPLIQDIIFNHCEFTEDFVETTISFLSSMKGLRRIKFVSCKFLHLQHGPTKRPNIITSLVTIFACQPSHFEETTSNIPKNRLDITWLDFKVPKTEKITDNEIIKLCKKGLKSLTQLRYLKIDLSFCSGITDVGVQTLVLKGIKYLTHLEFLELNLTKCFEVSDRSFSLLNQGLANLTQLTSLNLDVSRCFKITYRAIYDFCQKRLKILPKLEALTLAFWWESQITYQELDSLTMEKFKCLAVKPYFPSDQRSMVDKISRMCLNGLRYLTGLRSLSLSWKRCRCIHNDGIKSLARKGLCHLVQLTSLSLDFAGCSGITDAGLSYLSKEGLQYLTRLTSLNLDFSRYSYSSPEITDRGLSNLSKEGLKYLTRLTSLVLDFSHCSRISSNRFSDFTKEGLQNLTQLTSLYLNLKGCFKVTGDELHKLCAQISNLLKALASLELNFWWDHQIKLEHLHSAFSQKIKQLTLHPDLYQNRDANQKIVEMCRNELCYLTHFVDLDLNLSDWNDLSDHGILNLCTEWLVHLKDLTSLNLNFSNCHEITDEGIQALSAHGLRHFTSLTSLKLNFSKCYKITGEGIVDSFSQEFKYLSRLKTLKLNFSQCGNITDYAIKRLNKKAFQFLPQLENIDILPYPQNDPAQGEWQWQSNFDPFSLSKPKWMSYLLEQNSLLEKAYLDAEEELDLGDYTVSLKEMKQKDKKSDSALQIPVRRIIPGETEFKIENSISKTFYKQDLFPKENPTHWKFASLTWKTPIEVKGIWQYESNSKWEFYSFDHSEQIEKAFYQGIDLEIKGFWVSPTSLSRTEKLDPENIRPIRRIFLRENQETNNAFEQLFERELPEKINNRFENPSKFMEFMKRFETGDFIEMFENIEAVNDEVSLNQIILPQILICFQNEVYKSSSEKPSKSIISTLTNNLEARAAKPSFVEMTDVEKTDAVLNIIKFKMEKQCRGLTKVFSQNFENFQQFYACIIKVYKIDTFLSRNLNKYLRNESWDKLHYLLPYLFCLCKAFFSSETQALQEQRVFTLYRGARLDQDELSLYDPDRVKNFSWNWITSTTSNIEVASKFANYSVNKKDKTFPVLFFITIPEQEKELEYLRYLDVKLYSDVLKKDEIMFKEDSFISIEDQVILKEDEFLLPPGSAFELHTKFFDENEKSFRICLALK